MKTSPAIHGLMVSFEKPSDVLAAARRAYQEGYRKMDAYTPFAVEGLAEAIGFKSTRVPLIVLIGGIVGCVGGYLLQYWIQAIDYPVNVGGRPFHSAPAFIPVTFELTVLIAALSALLGMLALNGLPMPHHPVFNAPNFELASRNRFFLCIEAADPKFDREKTKAFLQSMNPLEVTEVAN